MSESVARSDSPEDDVLVAAGESAKESRGGGRPTEQRRRAHSIAAARLADPNARPLLRHAASSFSTSTTRDFIPPSPSPSALGSPSPSPIPSAQSGPSEASQRATLLQAKRSLPQLHNVWENFLEEASEEDVQSFHFPMPPQSPPRSPPQSPSHTATAHKRSSRNATSPMHPPLPRRLHVSSPTSSAVLTTASSSASLSAPRSPELSQMQAAPSNQLRPRGHARLSHQTSSSTSSAYTSNAGSTSSMAVFSSASSMTTVYDDYEDGAQKLDVPVPPTPQSSTSLSPRQTKFADPPISPSPVQRLRESPSPQLLPNSRGDSPTSSVSSGSCSGSTASGSHSDSTTPTPSSVSLTPPPSRSDASKQAGRLSSHILNTASQYRRSPDGGLVPEMDGCEGEDEDDEDMLSELGYYASASPRMKGNYRTPSSPSFSASPPVSPTPSGSLILPPPRRSSRNNLKLAATQQQSIPSSSFTNSLPRAKSASNIRHDARAALERASRGAGTVSPSKSSLWTRSGAASPGVSSYSYDLHHARSQTLQSANQLHDIVDPFAAAGIESFVPMASRPAQSRQRSGSASAIYTLREKALPLRPPPAPPLNMASTIPRNENVDLTSPISPAGTVQWGYAL